MSENGTGASGERAILLVEDHPDGVEAVRTVGLNRRVLNRTPRGSE